jgi:hypothetical protein
MKTVKSNVRRSLCQRKRSEKTRAETADETTQNHVGKGIFARPAERSNAQGCSTAMPEFNQIPP